MTEDHRVTIMLSKENNTKLRALQSKWIKEDQKGWSFSKVLNEMLKEVL